MGLDDYRMFNKKGRIKWYWRLWFFFTGRKVVEYDEK